MRFRRFLAGTIIYAAVTSACAHSGASDTSTTPRIEPPKMMRGDGPRLRSTGAFDARIEVVIDADGQPRMNTLHITGLTNEILRQDIEQWIAQSAFEPAKKDGVPVSGVIKIAVRSR